MTTTGSGKASPHLPELPDDVVWEILSWLPSKILWRFRTVSVSWYNQIAHPSFIKKQKFNFCERYNENHYYSPNHLPSYLHNDIPASDPCDFIESCNGLSRNEKEDYFPNYFPNTNLLGFPTYGRYAMIVGSCNGLLCFSNISEEEEPPESRIYLYNPSTGNTILLPRDPFSSGRDSTYSTYIRIGLYYDESNHEFKVVIIHSVISIYSLKNNSWEKIKKVRIPVWIPQHTSVSLKETIYWYCKSALIAFDSSKLAIRVIPYPDKDLRVLKTLNVVKGSLWIMGFNKHRNLCAWMMMKQEGDSEIWEKKFQCYMAKERYVLALSYQGRILFRDRRRRKLVTLDPETKEEETIGLRGDVPFLVPRDEMNLQLLESM